ncbi:aldehyde dehydrogenase family protein [Jiangella endophytica]|uniref:aldehyde dehydrogenase family protein n=1 Tax=Jiangella endophytica TaxID=1623398 RepID=UPI000E348F48|nr:aldehyde dehydrogenase family protein [Jiangella endophytica]
MADALARTAVPHPTDQFIGSTWVTARGTSTVDVVHAATEELVARLPATTIAEADAAVAAARTAFDTGGWASMTVVERAPYVERFRTAFDARGAEINAAWGAEAGMPVVVANAFSSMCAVIGDDSIATAKSIALSDVRDTPVGSVKVIREPVGTVLAILTYNGPGTEIAFGVLPALLMGNTVVVKLPPENRLVGQFIADAFAEAGFPAGVVSLLTADVEVSKHLVAHPDVDLVHFTGGTEIGADVAAVCAKRIARTVLELGGKAAAIVADDADLDTVVPSLVAGMTTYQGQLCVAFTRILVSRARHDELVERLVAALGEITIGDPADPSVTFGPMPSARIRDRAEGYVARAVAAGARIAHGGKRPAGLDKGFFLEPTLLVDVTNDMEVAQNEIFGPVYSVIAYDDVDDAIRIANDTRYGLASAVYTRDDELAWEVAGRIRVGAFAINGNFPVLCAPYGGVKKSGYGRVAGPEGMYELTSIKQIVLPAHQPA